ncbi:conserved hypothetical protein [Methylobacterium sp. 4-46]|uniref:hypothetical protein n=1 Tax=unclassified Methylobacterium TaxID=2615210 RepID=UPI000165CD66|nr:MULTISPECIES: hypothetical protein [Methylobacterium]ACA20107.1 conserved hypothetical protein [Methylobacterium sp. 4-46]WFT79290.1 hypothetical protein QA634_29375 [Methylobacterium nodulans]
MIAQAARGWLAAYAAWSGIPIGSLALLLIHGLTGGRWGEALAPVLRPAASLTPLAALAFLPIALGLAAIYPWAADPAQAPPQVAPLYLHPTFFLARSVLALVIWSVIGLVVAAGRGGGLFAAVALLLHAVLISVIAVDWVLSVEPGFTSSAFAAGFAIEQMLSALAFAALLAPPDLAGRDASDLAGLLLATLTGTVYIALMSFIVAWYGDLPDKAAWYLRRGQHGLVWLIVAAVAAGAVLPFGLLLNGHLRRSRAALRLVGGLVLLGIGLHRLWLVAPAYDPPGPPLLLGALGLLAAVAVTVGLVRLSGRLLARLFPARRLPGGLGHAG